MMNLAGGIDRASNVLLIIKSIHSYEKCEYLCNNKKTWPWATERRLILSRRDPGGGEDIQWTMVTRRVSKKHCCCCL